MAVSSVYNIFFPFRDPAYQGWYVLLNTLAGSIDIVDEPIHRALVAMKPPSADSREHETPTDNATVSQDVWLYLDRRGYLFDSREQEQEQSELLYRELLEFHRRVLRQPIVIIPTYHCNLQCTYCWQRLHNMDSGVISDQMIRKFFEILPEVLGERDPAQVDIVVFGGEPLMRCEDLPGKVHSILSTAKNVGYTTKIITNGVGLAAAATEIANVTDLIQVTMDGPPALHRKRRPIVGGDSFGPMAEGITKALASGIRINLRVNVDSENYTMLPEMAEYLMRTGWLSTNLLAVHLAPVKVYHTIAPLRSEKTLLRNIVQMVRQHDDLSFFCLDGFSGLKYFNGFKESAMLPLHRMFHCEAQINLFIFDLHGDVYPCYDAAGIRELSVGRYWPKLAINGENLDMWRTRKGTDLETCRLCSALPNCGGGCQFMAYERYACFGHPVCDSLIEGYRLAIEANEEWLMERARRGDHAVGLLSADRVHTEVTREFGYLDSHDRPLNHLDSC